MKGFVSAGKDCSLFPSRERMLSLSGDDGGNGRDLGPVIAGPEGSSGRTSANVAIGTLHSDEAFLFGEIKACPSRFRFCPPADCKHILS